MIQGISASKGLVNNSAFVWSADNVFHALTFVALQLSSPKRAHAWMKRAASVWPVVKNAEEAQASFRRLWNRGTCLSRSLAVAARCNGSEVVIGVARNTPPPARPGPSFQAHAWVEINGSPIDSTPTAWMEIGRLGQD